jgi:hypothetical protein
VVVDAVAVMTSMEQLWVDGCSVVEDAAITGGRRSGCSRGVLYDGRVRCVGEANLRTILQHCRVRPFFTPSRAAG